MGIVKTIRHPYFCPFVSARLMSPVGGKKGAKQLAKDSKQAGSVIGADNSLGSYPKIKHGAILHGLCASNLIKPLLCRLRISNGECNESRQIH